MTTRKEILRRIRKYAKEQGQELRTLEGANHTRVWVGQNYTTIPRHNEIPNGFAKKILKQIGVED